MLEEVGLRHELGVFLRMSEGEDEGGSCLFELSLVDCMVN